MEIRRGRREDGAACRALWAYCFEKPGDPFFEWFFRRLYRPEDVLLAGEGGRTMGALHLRPYALALRGRVLPVHYIVGVAVHPAARGRGIARALLTEAFRASAKDGRSVDILMPSDASFYRPLGFAMYAHQWERTAAPERLASLGERPVKAGLIEGPDDWAILAGIYRVHTARYSAYALRDEANWRQRIEGTLREGYIAVVSDGSGPAGYVVYSMDGRTLAAAEMAWASEAGRRGLYAYMAGHRGSVDTIRWYEPLSDRSYLFWADGAEHTYIQNRTFPFMTARITDMAAFSGPTEAEGEVSFRYEDPILSDKEGVYTLRAAAGKMTAEPGGAAAFSLTAAGAAHLLFGALAADDLFAFGEAMWLTDSRAVQDAALAFLRRAFPPGPAWISEWY